MFDNTAFFATMVFVFPVIMFLIGVGLFILALAVMKRNFFFGIVAVCICVFLCYKGYIFTGEMIEYFAHRATGGI